jgi:hypothetical protein
LLCWPRKSSHVFRDRKSTGIRGNDPPRDDIDGLDYQRCAALHNAIVEHGWTSSGRSLDAMPRTTWWDMQNDNPERDATVSLLHHSVVEFLKRAYRFNENNFHFFRYLTDLRGAGNLSMSFKEDLDDPDYENRFYTLYCTDETRRTHVRHLKRRYVQPLSLTPQLRPRNAHVPLSPKHS